MRASRLGAALALPLVCVGCETRPETELLVVRGLGPARVEVGSAIYVEGEGFPLGRRGELALRGECRGPGSPRRNVEHRFDVEAIREDRALAEVTRAFVERTGLRATCTFAATLRFEGPNTTVVGRKGDLELDVVPTGRDRIVGRYAEASRALEAARAFGLRFGEAVAEEGGLRVEQVLPNTPAARAGILTSEVVEVLDGVRMLDGADFLPRPGLRRTELLVRGTDGRLREVNVSTFVTNEVGTAASFGYAVLALFCMLLATFFAPTARFTSFLAAKPPEDPEATLGWLFGVTSEDARGRVRLRDLLAIAFGVACMSAAFAGVAVVGGFVLRGFGVGILLSASLALRMAARVFGEGDAEPSPYLPFFLASAPLTVVVTAVGLLVGTGHFGELLAAQGATPVRFLVFANPVAFALFPVFAATALTRVEPEGTTNRLAKVAARGHLMVVSALGAALFLGGWNSPTDVAWHGIALFVLKSFLLIGLGLWARSTGARAGHDAWTWTVPLALLGLTAAALYSYVGVPEVVARASGYVLSAVTVVLVAYVAVARTRPDEDRLVGHPFL